MIEPLHVFLRLALAAVLGAVIGLNRSRNEWTAGMRTHMLVSVGAALAIIVSAFGFRDVLGPNVVLDPSRIAAQVVSGIGFLGAGTIMFMQREQIVRGLTTAAGLWATASIGLAAGSGLYAAAAIATAVCWLILALLKPLERRLLAWRRRGGSPRLRLRLTDATALGSVEAIVSRKHLPLRKMILRRQEDGDDQVDLLFGPAMRNDQLIALADDLRELEGLQSVSFDSTSRTSSSPPTD